MSDYSKGKIYKLVDNTNGNIYIGSTIKMLCQRLCNHKYDYKKYLIGKYHFVTSFDIIKNGNFKIELIEEYPCNNKKELETRERYYIESINCINKNIPTRTDAEYYIVNKEKIKEYHIANKDRKIKYDKEYRLSNKEKIKEYKVNPFTCECGSIITTGHKACHLKSKKHLDYIESQKPKIKITLKLKI